MACFSSREPPGAAAETRFVNGICATKFDASASDEHIWHEQILQTVWMKLTGDKQYCLPVGAHWGDIGFQGQDPLTDLRGMGMFGLVQVAARPPITADWWAAADRGPCAAQMLSISSKYGAMARQIRLEINACYPFAATSINFTQMAVHALRMGWLDPQVLRQPVLHFVQHVTYVLEEEIISR
jgi:hypothetical protein